MSSCGCGFAAATCCGPDGPGPDEDACPFCGKCSCKNRGLLPLICPRCDKCERCFQHGPGLCYGFFPPPPDEDDSPPPPTAFPPIKGAPLEDWLLGVYGRGGTLSWITAIDEEVRLVGLQDSASKDIYILKLRGDNG